MHGAYAGYRTDAELRNTYSIKNAADAAGERERERERAHTRERERERERESLALPADVVSM